MARPARITQISTGLTSNDFTLNTLHDKTDYYEPIFQNQSFLPDATVDNKKNQCQRDTSYPGFEESHKSTGMLPDDDVTSTDTGNFPCISLKIEGNVSNAVTDIIGNYSIKVPVKGKVLNFSYYFNNLICL
jgi:hypothetical protein